MTITAQDVSTILCNYFTTRDPSDESQTGYDSLKYLRGSVLRGICQSISWAMKSDQEYLEFMKATFAGMQDGAPSSAEYEIRRTQERIFEKEAMIAVQEEMLNHFKLIYKLDTGREFVPAPSKINVQQQAAKAIAKKVTVATPATTSADEHAEQVKPRAIAVGSN